MGFMREEADLSPDFGSIARRGRVAIDNRAACRRDKRRQDAKER
jgi:hypothetical protein